MSQAARAWVIGMLGVALLLAALLGAPSGASSQAGWPCDTTVVDQAGVLEGGLAEVEEAADRLVRRGATVRVFIVQTTGINNLDLFVDDIEKRCRSWQAPDGERKNNLIILGVSVDEQSTGLFYGSVWLDLLEPEQLRIQSEIINPRFQAGDFAGGLVAGLNEISRLIDAQRHPPTATPPASTGAGSDEFDRMARIGAGVTLAVIVLGGATVGGLILYRSRIARRRAQQRARELKMRMADRVLRLPGEIAFVEAELTNLEARVAKEEYRDLPKKLAEARRLIDQVNADSRNIQMAGSDPDREGLSREEYESFAASFEEQLALLDQAGRAVSEVRSEIQALHDMADQLPAAVEQAEAARQVTRNEVAGYAAEFPNGQAEHLLDQAEAKIEQARQAGKKKDHGGR